MHEYGVTLSPMDGVEDMDCIIVAVAHDEFRKISLDDLKKMYATCPDEEKVLIDVKGIYNISALTASGLRYWRL